MKRLAIFYCLSSLPVIGLMVLSYFAGVNYPNNNNELSLVFFLSGIPVGLLSSLLFIKLTEKSGIG